ncbi:MAG TPA: hypothetical protein VGE66_10135 [Chitinophagaceae bacterium]
MTLIPFYKFRTSALVASALLLAMAGNGQGVDFRKMTAEERQAYMARINAASYADRKKMLEQLRIVLPQLPPDSLDPARPAHTFRQRGTGNWIDSAGQFYARSEWGAWTNYDEAKAGAYTLPDPLVLNNGQRVTSAKDWWNKRRPEILEYYRNEVYGKIPDYTPKVTFEVVSTDSSAVSGTAILKKIVGRIDNSSYPSDTPRIEISLYLPKDLKGQVPMMVQVSGAFFAPPEKTASQPAGARELVLAQGWAFATVNTTAIQADNGAGLTKGIIGLVNKGQPRKPEDWGVLAAWSWGLSRAMDYFQTDKAIDGRKIGLQGHSRWGKTALLTAALDQRWAIVFPTSSGAMGASLEKRNYGETIDIVAGTGEYHWMAGNFLKYGGNWSALPVDAHHLIALVAPRPVFITGGTQERWIDTEGEFLACVAAEPVYRLLGKKGLGTTTMPAPDHALVEGEIAFRNHTGGHVDLPNWPAFLQWAKRYFK